MVLFLGFYLSDGQNPEPRLIPLCSVIINCSIILFRSAFAFNYLLLTKGQQSIKYKMEKQIGSSGIF